MITPITDQTVICFMAIVMELLAVGTALILHQKGNNVETGSLIVFGTLLTGAFIWI